MSLRTCEICGTGWILASLLWREYFSMLMCLCVCVELLGVSRLRLWRCFLISVQLPRLGLAAWGFLATKCCFGSHFPGLVPHPQGEVRDLKFEPITGLSKWIRQSSTLHLPGMKCFP